MKKFIVILVFSLAGQSVLQGQTTKNIERDLKATYEKILYWKFNPPGPDNALSSYDSIGEWGIVFRDKLLRYTSTHPATLKHPFDSLQEHVTIATSPDKNFRIYSWDTWTGGTMHFFDNVYQFNASGKIKAQSSAGDGADDPKSAFYKIFGVRSAKKTIYIAAYSAVYSGRDKAGGVKLFTIEREGLNDSIKLFRTSTGLHNTIHYNFDMVSMEEGIEIPEVKWEAATRTLFIPLIDDRDKPTGRFIRYRFDGNVFRKIK